MSDFGLIINGVEFGEEGHAEYTTIPAVNVAKSAA